MQDPTGWRDRMVLSRNAMIGSARFQRLMLRIPLLAGFARRRASAMFDLINGYVHAQSIAAGVGPRQPAARSVGDFGIEADRAIGRADPLEVGRACPKRRDQIDVDAQRAEQLPDLDQIVAMAKAERGRTQDVGDRAASLARRGAHVLVGQPPDQLVEGFGRPPVFLAAVAGQFERDHRNVQPGGLGQPGGIVLDQLGRARCPGNDRLRLEARGRVV